MSPTVLVIGVGNASRGDDAAGLEVARRIADVGPRPGIKVLSHGGDGVALLDLWDGADAVVIIDSMRSGAAPGTIHRIDASSTPVAVPLGEASTHALGVAEAIELARALDTLPPTVVVYGVEGANYEIGSSPGESVASAIDLAASAVHCEALDLLARLTAGGGSRRVAAYCWRRLGDEYL